MSDPISDDTKAKEAVSIHFGRSAAYYEQHANIQREVADRLIASLKPWRYIIPAGPILEIGCGTGFVTRGLIELFPDRVLEVTDVAPAMVRFCRNKFEGRDNVEFRIFDGERPGNLNRQYAMTISGFVAQWFKDPAHTLGKFLDMTSPGGLLLASFPGNDSFPVWKACCRELGIPFTGNRLPDTEELVVKLSTGQVQVDFYEDRVSQSFNSSADFFRHLKQLGAGFQREGRHLSPKELSMLISHWDEKAGETVDVQYHVVFLAVKKDML